MAAISLDDVIGQLVAVLEEGFEHPPKPWTYFTNNEPGSGLFGTLADLSAADASRPWGGTSIAAHVHHIIFGLGASSAWIQGDRTFRNWAESWSVSTVDDVAWSQLVERLRAGYEALRRSIESHASSSVESMGGAIGAVAHVAYHLGAIRQKLSYGRAG
ncbi:MAG: hypothetical protein GTO22_07260 [Gemmatimonadales bacterium]|nr:hypothetical protein [Gemmatimonadales bacterium]